MKRSLWICGMAVATLLILAPPKSEAFAFESCQDEECTRDLQCLVSCPPCTGAPMNPGVCWYDEQD